MGPTFSEGKNPRRVFARDDDIDLEKVDGPQTRRFLEEIIGKEVAPDIPRLVELAKSVGSKIAMLPDLSCNCCDCRDPNRPNFGPMQVRHLCQIKEGLTYLARRTFACSSSEFHAYEEVETQFKITRAPYFADNKWKADVVQGNRAETIQLAAYSIVPFSAMHTFHWGRRSYWHENYLSFTKDSEHLAGPHKDHCSCCRHHYQESK